jgi:DNA-binding Lrp family transcriptional regulator
MVDKSVLDALADQVNDMGCGNVCFPKIAKRLGLSERGARNIIKRLIYTGYLVLIGKQDGWSQILINLAGDHPEYTAGEPP